ncbi:MAG: hypothetical protein ABL949_02695 [Fimbriimonadaceae bacterium]
MLLTNIALLVIAQQPALPEHIFAQIDPGRDVVRVDGKNLALLSPIHVAGNVQFFDWVGNSQLHALEIEPGEKSLQTTIHSFSSSTRKDTPLRLKPNEMVEQFAGVGEGQYYFSSMLTGADGKVSYQLSFVRGSKVTQLLNGSELLEFAEFAGNLIVQPQADGPFLWYRDGAVVREFRYSDGKRRAVSSDETGIVLLVFEPGTEPGRGVRAYGFDPKAGDFVSGERPYGAQARLRSVNSRTLPIQIPGIDDGAQAALLMGDEKSEFPAALIAADCSRAIGSPDRKSIAYITQGHAFVRPIIEVTDEQLEDLLEKREAKRLLSQVKQVGIGWMIYGSDSDNVLPGSTEKTSEMIMPYLKNEKLLQGFAYSFGGGDISKVEDPTKTVLGYVQGKYGRAVVYLDSHARWESRKKKP